jgi:hypothetical protein
MNAQNEIPTIRRTVTAMPRRTATETWTTVTQLFREFFRGDDLEELLEIVLSEVKRQAHCLIALQELMGVEVVGGNEHCVAVDIVYGSLEAQDDVEAPLVPVSDYGQFQNIEVFLVVRDRLQEMREVIGLMGYRAPGSVSVCLRNERGVFERSEPTPIPDPLQF